MTSGIRCSECGAQNRLFDAMNESFLAIAREVKLDAILKCIVDAAAQLLSARFAAVGVPGEDGRFAAWITSGPPGEAPPLDGVLAHVLTLRTTWTTSDLAAEPQAGHWPAGLPAVSSLLGVPIVAEDEVLGAFYLGNHDRWGFTPEDRRMIELIAPHAAVAIANARLHERSRELTVIQERTRLARELHDSVTQALFSMRLAADTTLALIDGDPDGARGQVERLSDLARTALSEMRALLAELRPPEVASRGIAETLRGHVEVLRQVHGIDVQLETRLQSRLDARCEAELFRVAQEALANAVRHSGAAAIVVRLEDDDGPVRLSVCDDGHGFDPQSVSGQGRFGLVSMRERAETLGALLTIRSDPAKGTHVTVEVPA